jgi:hypothetical protein
VAGISCIEVAYLVKNCIAINANTVSNIEEISQDRPKFHKNKDLNAQ